MLEKLKEEISRDIILDLIEENQDNLIKLNNPSVLAIPEDKRFWEMTTSHYKDQIDKNGKAPILAALLQIRELWAAKEPKISDRAQLIINNLR